MSGTNAAPSPRAPRAQHPSAKQAAQASPNNNGNRGQRRNRGNRAHNGNHATTQHGASGSALQDPTLSESAVLSGEEVAMPVGPRQPKKHTRSQPSADRVFSPNGAQHASHTDTELGPTHSAATPVKIQGKYAGPTFHASPAPSSLPIPSKFLSKSVPPKTHTSPPTPPPEEGSDSGSSPSPSPSRVPPHANQQDSPGGLDMLFRADRAEKARNVNSPPAAMFPPNVAAAGGRPHHFKHDSFGSLNAPFPIELEANSNPTHASPPGATLANHRSVTAPSKIPQVETSAQAKESEVMKDLMYRLSLSQTKSGSSTPPKTASSDNMLQNHSPSPFHDGRPSPFRSASGPATPAPPVQAQDNTGLLYGNQNLSSKFKAAKTDSAKKSGLRTEITADSPMFPQGGFHQMPQPNNAMRVPIGNATNNPGGPRRGSAPHIAPIPPYRGAPNHPNQRNYQPRPDSYPNRRNNGHATNTPTNPPVPAPKTSSAMAFIPSSVRAKPPPTPPRKPEDGNSTLEQDLKRMLNLSPGNTNSVR